MGKIIDLKGQRFGNLVVQKRSRKRDGKYVYWICLCDCGRKKSVAGRHITSKTGATTSCGCIWKARLLKGNFKHGQSKTPRWNVWANAKSRAKKNGIIFTLKFEDVPEIPKTCPILDIPLFNGVKVCCPNSPSLDRKIPSKGYVPGNVEIISQRANQIKSDATVEELGRVYNYMKKK